MKTRLGIVNWKMNKALPVHESFQGKTSGDQIDTNINMHNGANRESLKNKETLRLWKDLIIHVSAFYLAGRSNKQLQIF